MATVGDLQEALEHIDKRKTLVIQGVEYLDIGEIDVSEGADFVWIEYGDYQGNDE